MAKTGLLNNMAMTCNFGKRRMPLTIHHNWRNKSWTFWSSPPLAGSPHTTMDPSIRMAAKAEVVATNDSTLRKRHWTFEASPPKSGSPHETIRPSSQMAAKARKVAWICRTFWSFSCTARLSPPASWFPQVTTVRSDRIAANAPDAVAWICCTCFNWSTTSPQMARINQKCSNNLLQSLIVSWVHEIFNFDSSDHKKVLKWSSAPQEFWRQVARVPTKLLITPCHNKSIPS